MFSEALKEYSTDLVLHLYNVVIDAAELFFFFKLLLYLVISHIPSYIKKYFSISSQFSLHNTHKVLYIQTIQHENMYKNKSKQM